MNIHELNYVLCIAKHQNMTKAARELYISQPTLSKHLGKLERELGIKDVYKRPGFDRGEADTKNDIGRQ